MSGMTRVALAVRSWGAKRRAQIALLVRFGPMTARAYGALLGVVVRERLWDIPDRARRDIATGRSSP
jgi:hypothetical protein